MRSGASLLGTLEPDLRKEPKLSQDLEFHVVTN